MQKNYVFLKSEIATKIGFKKVETLRKKISGLIDNEIIKWGKSPYITAADAEVIFKHFLEG